MKSGQRTTDNSRPACTYASLRNSVGLGLTCLAMALVLGAIPRQALANCTCGCYRAGCDSEVCSITCGEQSCGACSNEGCTCRCGYGGQQDCQCGGGTCSCEAFCPAGSWRPCSGTAVYCGNTAECNVVYCPCGLICPAYDPPCGGSGCDYNQGYGCGGAGCMPGGCSNKCRLSPLQCSGPTPCKCWKDKSGNYYNWITRQGGRACELHTVLGQSTGTAHIVSGNCGPQCLNIWAWPCGSSDANCKCKCGAPNGICAPHFICPGPPGCPGPDAGGLRCGCSSTGCTAPGTAPPCAGFLSGNRYCWADNSSVETCPGTQGGVGSCCGGCAHQGWGKFGVGCGQLFGGCLKHCCSRSDSVCWDWLKIGCECEDYVFSPCALAGGFRECHNCVARPDWTCNDSGVHPPPPMLCGGSVHLW
jgi:hypothetical protein